MALKSDDTRGGLGGASFGVTAIPTGLDIVVAIAAGDDHALALSIRRQRS